MAKDLVRELLKEPEHKKKERKNTYLPKEYFKVMILSDTLENAQEAAIWITGSNNPIRGIYNCSFNKTQMVVYYRWPDNADKPAATVAIDVLAIFLKSYECWEKMIDEVEKYKYIPVKAIVSFEKYAQIHDNFDAHWVLRQDSRIVRETLDSLDQKEFRKVKHLFGKHKIAETKDLILISEIQKYFTETEPNVVDSNFIDSLQAFSSNSVNLNIVEFIQWWKIGRLNTKATSFLLSISKEIKKFLNAEFDYFAYKNQISEFNEKLKFSGSTKTKLSNTNITFRSMGNWNLKSFIDLTVITGSKRVKFACDFINDFTKNNSPVVSNWIAIKVNLVRNAKIETERINEFLHKFKANLIKLAELTGNEALINFTKNFILFDLTSKPEGGLVFIRFKIDIEDIFKNLIQEILYIIDNMNVKNESFMFTLEFHSNEDLIEAIKSGKTLKDFLEVCEFLLEGSYCRENIKILLKNLLDKNVFNLTEIFQLAYDLYIELDGKISECSQETIESLLKFNLGSLFGIDDFINNTFDKELIRNTSNIELAMNSFNVFSYIKFACKSLCKI